MATRLDYERLAEAAIRFLTSAGPSPARTLREHLRVSQPTFSRLAGTLSARLLVVGRGRSTRYAARRHAEGVGRDVPVYEIDEAGGTRLVATLFPIEPRGFWVASETGEIDSGRVDDLPFFLHDARPAGFLGRLVPRRHPELELPSDVRLWSADDVLRYLVRYGWDVPGSFVVGEGAFGLFLKRSRSVPACVPAPERPSRYEALADDVLSLGVAGSSAAGEQPKFLVATEPGHRRALVKFTPPLRDETARRWADLLICEHLASRVLNEGGHAAAASELVEGVDRLFLEVERFDRVGESGRRGTLSLTAIAVEHGVTLSSWSATAAELVAASVIDEATRASIRWRELFGRLIGDTDQHSGNLSFFTRGTRITGLAPAYDVLPMAYAPTAAGRRDPTIDPPLPKATDGAIWSSVYEAALEFWRRAESHPMVTEAFAQLARDNFAAVEALSDVAARLPRLGR